jgi:hypothetical protein
MSKALAATCKAQVVTAEGVPVPGAVILSEGVGQSDGVLVLSDGRMFYLAKISPDLKATLVQVIAALGQAKTAFDKAASSIPQLKLGLDMVASAVQGLGVSGLVSAVEGATANVAADVAAITTASGQIQAAKTQLETLKDNLR